MNHYENKRITPNCPKRDMAAIKSDKADTTREAAENRQAAFALTRASSEYSRNDRACSSSILFCDSSTSKARMKAGSSSSVGAGHTLEVSDNAPWTPFNDEDRACGKSNSGGSGTPRRRNSENPFGKPLSASFLTFSKVIFILSVISLVAVIVSIAIGNKLFLIIAALPTPLLIAYSFMGLSMAKHPL